MISILLELLRISPIDRTLQNKLYKLHPSFPHLFPAKRLESYPILSEYISTVIHTITFGMFFYFLFCTIDYVYFFKIKKSKFIPKLEGKFFILQDITASMENMLKEAFLVALIRVAHPRLSFAYYNVNDYPLWWIPLSICLHMIFDETCTYWAHRWLHTYKFLYQNMHIIHHRSVDVTPYAAFAFHYFDAFMQAAPTFLSCFFFPLHINIILVWSFITMCWAISIHDNVPALPFKIFLYSTHHTIHHERGEGSFKNYGKFTSVWDRMMGTYDDPDRIDFGFKSPIKDALEPANSALAKITKSSANSPKKSL